MGSWSHKLLASFVAVAALWAGGCTEKAETTCRTDDECFVEGYVCDTTYQMCLKACARHSDCLKSEACDIPAGETEGVCRPSDGTSGDGGGDPGSDGAPGDTAGDPAPGDPPPGG